MPSGICLMACHDKFYVTLKVHYDILIKQGDVIYVLYKHAPHA